MLHEITVNVGWAIVFAVVGGVVQLHYQRQGKGGLQCSGLLAATDDGDVGSRSGYHVDREVRRGGTSVYRGQGISSSYRGSSVGSASHTG